MLQTSTTRTPLFPLRISDNHRFLVDASGAPFLYHADTAWKLFLTLDLQEAGEYLLARKAQSFNAIQVMLTGFLGDRNAAGRLPFGGDHDLARPDEAYFAHVDAVIEKAAQLDLLLAIVPLWVGCCGEGWGGKSEDSTPTPLHANGAAKCREFGRFVGNRYQKFSHLAWIIGGDRDPLGDREELRQLALGIKETAPGHLMTYHPSSTHSSTDVWPGETWLDVSMIYTYFRGFDKAWNKNQPDVYEEGYREWNKTPVKPFVLGESTYEGEHDDWGSALQARKQAYWALLSGSCGHAYGSPNWRVSDEWREITQLPGAVSLRHFFELFSSRAWQTLVPDQNNEVVTGGQGAFASNDYATTARTTDGSLVLAYSPTAPRTLTVDMSQLSGPTLARWFDPSSGEMTPIADALLPNEGSRQFSSPLKNQSGASDFVLVLEATPQL